MSYIPNSHESILIGLSYGSLSGSKEERALNWALKEIEASKGRDKAEIGFKRLYLREKEQIEQTLGRALGFPRFSDDSGNFPSQGGDIDQICTGPYEAVDLAEMAAQRIQTLTEQLEATKEKSNG